MPPHPSRRDLLRAIGLGLPAALVFACKRDGLSAPLAERAVVKRIDAQETREGAGVRLRRALGSQALSMLDPFLLLDEIHSERLEDQEPGFPTHPHRGFETVTYMIHGAVEHRDSLGNHGRLGPGCAQWMTAGHGIVHSEMPQSDGGLMWGFQLWVNLPAARKLVRPRYQDIPAERVVELSPDGAGLRLVAGELQGQRGPVEGIVTAPEVVDVRLPPGTRFARPLPVGHNAFAYVCEGECVLGAERTPVAAGQLAVLGPGELVSATSPRGGRMLLVAGRPIGEPVARYGPFVMNTQDELRQAVEDYRSGRLVDG